MRTKPAGAIFVSVLFHSAPRKMKGVKTGGTARICKALSRHKKHLKMNSFVVCCFVLYNKRRERKIAATTGEMSSCPGSASSHHQSRSSPKEENTLSLKSREHASSFQQVETPNCSNRVECLAQRLKEREFGQLYGQLGGKTSQDTRLQLLGSATGFASRPQRQSSAQLTASSGNHPRQLACGSETDGSHWVTQHTKTRFFGKDLN